MKSAHAVYPAAGKEASGTGNMKFTLNGALTIGTLDGAENFFLFGLSAEEVASLQARGYRPRDFYERDNFMLLADYRAYVDAQAAVDRAFGDPALWTRMSILNVARAAKFSSDRAIREYGEQIWDMRPVTVTL